MVHNFAKFKANSFEKTINRRTRHFQKQQKSLSHIHKLKYLETIH
jgi:hypothetical protein